MLRLALVAVLFCPALSADDKPKEKPKDDKPVKGLIALTEVSEPGDGWIEIKLSLKNVTDKPITTGYYAHLCWLEKKDRHVRVDWTGPDGKKRESKHDDFPPANNPPMRKSDFVTIQPGKTLAIRPVVRFHPDSLKPPPEGDRARDAWRTANAAEPGEHRVVVSFSNTHTNYATGGGYGTPPSGFVEVDGAWSGVVSAKEVKFKVK